MDIDSKRKEKADRQTDSKKSSVCLADARLFHWLLKTPTNVPVLPASVSSTHTHSHPQPHYLPQGLLYGPQVGVRESQPSFGLNFALGAFELPQYYSTLIRDQSVFD